MKPLLHKHNLKLFSVIIFICSQVNIQNAISQEILPPLLPWKGRSLELIAKKNDPWITPTEESDFNTTPSYQETTDWLRKLCQSTPNLRLQSAGKSANRRDIHIVIASSDGIFEKEALRKSTKPLLLIQAGIHAGEIDGKDAGMMLLRDITNGNKKNLLGGVNLIFIPILNVDGHERISKFNRVNQRGPSNMGWRTNARNLNLNRDYSKLDTEEIMTVVNVINEYDPDLYLDLHVTDGADYQYDITYGFSQAYSPDIGKWLKEKLSPSVDKYLKDMGHIPGPLIFAANNRDFQDGMIEYPYSARFSNNYGDIRHLPSILVENHSLKPFKQRVLGTYVFLEAVINILTKEGASLKSSIEQDRKLLKPQVVLTWKQTEKTDTVTLLGIESERKKSQVTGKDYVQWKGKAITQRIPFLRYNAPDKEARRPKAYWVPSTYKDVVERLRLHGVEMEVIHEKKEIDVTLYKIREHKFSSQPFEGHVGMTGNFKKEISKETFYPGSVRIDTNQPLGDLVMHLLEPDSPDSFLQWGFFSEIFNRTEYIEEYAIEPLATKMLAGNEKLKDEFETFKKDNPDEINNPQAIYEWFYARSPYVDSRYLLYPVGREE